MAFLSFTDMMENDIKANAPKGATHYLLVPNGSGDPYYLTFDGVDYYFYHSKDKFELSHMVKHIKPL